MSNAIMNLCRPARMPPTPKNVLMALADRADDAGLAWPSLAGLSEATCFSRTAVIDAIKWLEQHGVLTVAKEVGKNSRFRIVAAQVEALTPARPVREAYRHPSGSHTGTAGAPVREADATGTAGAPPPVREADGPVRQAHPNHQEPSVQPSGNHQKARTRSTSPTVERPMDVTEQVWTDWLALRRAKKAPVTETVLREARNEAAKASMAFEGFLRVWCARGSQGLQAAWLRPHERSAAASDAASRNADAMRLLGIDYSAGLTP